MGAESGDAVTGRGPRLLGSTGGLGFGLVSGGVLLALYSLTCASEVPENWESYQGTSALDQAQGLARHYAWSALVLGLLVLAAMAIGAVEVIRSSRWILPKTDWVRTAVVLAVGAGIAVLPVMAVSGHLVRRYREVRGDVPSFASLPTALTAGGLVVAGSLLLALPLWRSMIPLWRPGVVAALSLRRGVAIAAAAGLVVSGTLAAVAVRVADDPVRFDHTLAAATAAPSVPNRLGPERYRIPLAEVSTADGPRTPDVVVAGAGFVVSSAAGVTAYDGATGAPRWHYLSTYPTIERSMPLRQHDTSTRVGYSSGTLQSVDGGKVVVANWGRVGWNAFDAMTGEILWHHSDYTRDIPNLDRWTAEWTRTRSMPGFLIRHDTERLVRYDGRTGARLWSANLAMRLDPPTCPDQRVSAAMTEGAIYVLVPCAPGDSTRATVTEIDPANGTVVATREFENAETATLTQVENAVVVNWYQRSPSALAHLTLTGPRQLATTVVDNSDVTSIIAADSNGAQQLRRVYRDSGDKDPFAVVASDTGAVLYRLPGFFDPQLVEMQNILFLRDEIVQLPDNLGSRTLTYDLPVRSWSREDGHPVTSRPAGKVNYQVLPHALAAPGAVLVFWTFLSDGALVGYGD
ncbi:hypothetical protein [Nocardia sp. NPDC004722]